MKNIATFIKSHRIQLLVFCISLAILFLRRPDALLNAQFWAEDGRNWLGQAYDSEYSLLTLIEPYAGYLVLLQRGVGLLSGLFPLEYSPLIFNICALLVQTLPLIYLWSKRTDYISTKLKIFITIVYLFLPFTAEVHANITNAQWFLAIALFLLLFIKDAKSKAVQGLDYVVIALASLTGPFSILLAPVVAFEAYRLKRIRTRYVIMFCGAAVQLCCVAILHKTASQEYVGPSITQLIDIIGGQVFGAGLLGYASFSALLSKPWVTPLLAVLGFELLAYVFIKSNRMIRYFLIFGIFTLVAALVSPNGSTPNMSWWETLNTEGKAGRYYVFIHLGIFLCLGWLVFSKSNMYMKAIGVTVLLFSLVGIIRDFKNPPYIDMRYKSYIQQYNHAKSGQVVHIPLNPEEPWAVDLKKK